jgi:hypothetical protein
MWIKESFGKVRAQDHTVKTKKAEDEQEVFFQKG